MAARALALGLLLLAAPARAFRDDNSAGNVFTVYDRDGDLITVSNRMDGPTSFVELTSTNRLRTTNWDRTHSDEFMERATAVAVDPSGTVIVAGARLWQGSNYMWLTAYDQRGQRLWERADTLAGCTAFNLAVNENGEVWAAGSCMSGDNSPVRVLHFNASGGLQWIQTYNEGGRNYVRNMTVDFVDRVNVTIEVASGQLGGVYVRTLVFDRNGSRVTMY